MVIYNGYVTDVYNQTGIIIYPVEPSIPQDILFFPTKKRVLSDRDIEAYFSEKKQTGYILYAYGMRRSEPQLANKFKALGGISGKMNDATLLLSPNIKVAPVIISFSNKWKEVDEYFPNKDIRDVKVTTGRFNFEFVTGDEPAYMFPRLMQTNLYSEN